MKSIVIYSSLTGNTKSVAEAMASVMPEGTPCLPVKDAPENLADYDTVFVGFWVDRGTANKEAAKLIETLKKSNIGWGITAVESSSDYLFMSISNKSTLIWDKKGKIANTRWLQYVGLWSIPLGYIAGQAGWIVAEVGRQPWAIQDILPTSASISKLNPSSVQTTFYLFLILFTILLIAEIGIMVKAIKKGPEAAAH